MDLRGGRPSAGSDAVLQTKGAYPAKLQTQAPSGDIVDYTKSLQHNLQKVRSAGPAAKQKFRKVSKKSNKLRKNKKDRPSTEPLLSKADQLKTN